MNFYSVSQPELHAVFLVPMLIVALNKNGVLRPSVNFHLASRIVDKILSSASAMIAAVQYFIYYISHVFDDLSSSLCTENENY